jgi:N-acetylglutamate synthase-like GNAT family acetyltransferase
MLARSLKNDIRSRSLPKWKLRHHVRPGDIGYLIHLHGAIYAEEHGYDQTFEAYVADGLARFIRLFNPDRDRIWLAETNGQIIGSIAIVGYSRSKAQLRWFFVHPKYRRISLGRKLLNEALHFCKQCKYKTVFLWTTCELSAAQHLYTGVGFRRTRKKTHRIWGKSITEERYDLDLRAKQFGALLSLHRGRL